MAFLELDWSLYLRKIIAKARSSIFLKNSDYLYLRDDYSYEMVLKQLKFKQLPSLRGDLAFLDLTIYEKFLKPLNQEINIANISFSGKNWWGESRAKFYSKQLMPLIKI